MKAILKEKLSKWFEYCWNKYCLLEWLFKQINFIWNLFHVHLKLSHSSENLKYIHFYIYYNLKIKALRTNGSLIISFDEIYLKKTTTPTWLLIDLWKVKKERQLLSKLILLITVILDIIVFFIPCYHGTVKNLYDWGNNWLVISNQSLKINVLNHKVH